MCVYVCVSECVYVCVCVFVFVCVVYERERVCVCVMVSMCVRVCVRVRVRVCLRRLELRYGFAPYKILIDYDECVRAVLPYQFGGHGSLTMMQ